MDYSRAVPWRDLSAGADTPGPLAGAIVALARWALANLIPVVLVLAVAVLGVVALLLLMGRMDRDRVLARAVRVAVAVISVLVAGSGLFFLLVVQLADAINKSAAQ